VTQFDTGHGSKISVLLDASRMRQKRTRRCTCKIVLKRVRVIIFVLDKKLVLYILGM
jgi:hypothetical protein